MWSAVDATAVVDDINSCDEDDEDGEDMESVLTSIVFLLSSQVDAEEMLVVTLLLLLEDEGSSLRSLNCALESDKQRLESVSRTSSTLTVFVTSGSAGSVLDLIFPFVARDDLDKLVPVTLLLNADTEHVEDGAVLFEVKAAPRLLVDLVPTVKSTLADFETDLALFMSEETEASFLPF